MLAKLRLPGDWLLPIELDLLKVSQTSCHESVAGSNRTYDNESPLRTPNYSARCYTWASGVLDYEHSLDWD